MKKIISLLLALSLIAIILTSCQNDLSGKINSANTDVPDDDQYYFTGKVVEIYEKGCLIEVTDAGNQHLSVGNKVDVHTNIENCPAYSEGDSLKIVFDGMVAESYPPQILKVFEITVIP